MFIASCFISVFIAWIWVDYFRLIDIYERESPVYFIITFLLGGASVLIVLFTEQLLSSSPFVINGTFINDFLYCVFRIGAVEEFAKFIPFLIVLLLFRKQINEPVDYFVYLAISALGFSAIENILYFDNHGPQLIISRSILSTLGHVFDTSLIACGFILYKYKTHRYPLFTLLGFFLLASLAHGFYDFWLIFEGTKEGGFLITILYFFFTISIFATILNNALNNSNFFSYKKVVDSKKVGDRLLFYYALVFGIQTIMVTIQKGAGFAFTGFLGSLFTTGFIVIIAVIRLSRFKLIKDRWNRIKIELPFRIILYTSTGDFTFRIRIKGESFNEVYVNAFYEEYFLMFPFSKKNSGMEFNQVAYIEKKLFLYNDETYYLGKIFNNDRSGTFSYRLLKPKTTDVTMKKDKYPIVAVLNFDSVRDFENSGNRVSDFVFESWAFIKPMEENTVPYSLNR
jgi:RsiW-degrading membrane proteinase PrsW (M82 family)